MTAKTESQLLDHYHCTFFLPLIGVEKRDFEPDGDAWCYPADATLKQVIAAAKEGEPNKEAKAREIEAQAYRYFSPAIRNILFNCSSDNSKPNHLEPIQEWRIKPERLASWELHIGNQEEADDPTKYQQAKITAVTLYRYFNGIYLLAFRVEPKALAQLPKESPLFDNELSGDLQQMVQRDPANKHHYQQLQLESWLHFTRMARLIYPSFPQQNTEKKIAPIHLKTGKKSPPAFREKQRVAILEKPGEDISPVIREILKAFTNKPEGVDRLFDYYRNIYDDRMFVSVAYGLAGRQLPPEQLQKLFHLALYVDRHVDTFDALKGNVYTPEALESLTKERSFDLWNGLGGHYGYTEFSNVYLYNGWDFRTYIAPEHIPYIYDRMLIQALFYQASLRYYDNLICHRTQKLLDQDNLDLQSIRELRKGFIRFTNQYWFHNLTEQMQGKEIFRLQQAGLELKEHYEIIKDELERTDEYLQTEHELRVQKFTERFTRWGLVIAFIALYYTVLPLMLDYIKVAKEVSMWELIGNGVTTADTPASTQQLVGMIFTLVIIPVALVLITSGIRKLKSLLKG